VEGRGTSASTLNADPPQVIKMKMIDDTPTASCNCGARCECANFARYRVLVPHSLVEEQEQEIQELRARLWKAIARIEVLEMDEVRSVLSEIRRQVD